ncbi:GNAT family N-acetyltransferase [Methylocapsa sp. S129]|uniref:GNAT family N-acetyltransferase n=1 Tax=Methylocapsa sp. S129 TaxID=1641869 RepID=UPI00131CCCF9|nr:GNAT family protein [Methylocapsa sp. S129]
MLRGATVALEPLEMSHQAQLVEAASDGELWTLQVTVVPGPDTVRSYVERALAGRDAGTVMPFVIVERATGRVVGSTRFWKIDQANRKLEIGATWLARSAQRSGVNTEAKYLMLSHAFEAMKFIRVQFTTDELNERSRAAILRLGAVEEGVIRHERIMPDGRKRNSVRYSIIDAEWPAVKLRLEQKMSLGRT